MIVYDFDKTVFRKESSFLFYLFCARRRPRLLLRLPRIARYGLLSPIIVRRGAGGRYELIAGARRLRALRRLGLDTADALASNGSRQKKLEILKDSRCGAFAVMACAGYLLLSFALWAECRKDLLFILPAFPASRALSALAAVNLRPAREEGMLRSFTDEEGRKAVTAASLLWLALCLLLWSALAAVAASPAVLIAPALVLAAALPVYRHLAYRDFGGVTGDLAGAFLQLTELALLAAFVIGEAMV